MLKKILLGSQMDGTLISIHPKTQLTGWTKTAFPVVHAEAVEILEDRVSGLPDGQDRGTKGISILAWASNQFVGFLHHHSILDYLRLSNARKLSYHLSIGNPLANMRLLEVRLMICFISMIYIVIHEVRQLMIDSEIATYNMKLEGRQDMARDTINTRTKVYTVDTEKDLEADIKGFRHD